MRALGTRGGATWLRSASEQRDAYTRPGGDGREARLETFEPPGKREPADFA